MLPVTAIMNINLFISILIIPASKLLNGTIVAINFGLVRVDTKDLILKITLEMGTLKMLNGLWEVNSNETKFYKRSQRTRIAKTNLP